MFSESEGCCKLAFLLHSLLFFLLFFLSFPPFVFLGLCRSVSLRLFVSLYFRNQEVVLSFTIAHFLLFLLPFFFISFHPSLSCIFSLPAVFLFFLVLSSLSLPIYLLYIFPSLSTFYNNFVFFPFITFGLRNKSLKGIQSPVNKGNYVGKSS